MRPVLQDDADIPVFFVYDLYNIPKGMFESPDMQLYSAVLIFNDKYPKPNVV